MPRVPNAAPVMRIVADTNTVLSGLLWQGPPRRLLDLARQRAFTLCTSPTLLAEVIARDKFAQLEERLDKKLTEHDRAIGAILSAIRELMHSQRPVPKHRPIGFTADLEESRNTTADD